MFLGSVFAFAWTRASNAAKKVTAAIAAGEKVIGQIPVALDHLEDLAQQAVKKEVDKTINEGVDVVLKGEKVVAAKVGATVSEWETWMDAKAAKVVKDLHLPIDPSGVQKAGDRIFDDVQGAVNGMQNTVEDTVKSIGGKLTEAAANRLQFAKDLGDALKNAGKNIGDTVVNAAKTIESDIKAGLKSVAGALVDGIVDTVGGAIKAVSSVVDAVKGAYQKAKALFTGKPVDDPVASCAPSQEDEDLKNSITNDQQLLESAKDQGLADSPEAMAVAAQVDASQKLLMSQDVYNDDSPVGAEVAPGWKRLTPDQLKALNLNPDEFQPKDSEFRAALYQSDDSPPKYTLAFKGTTMTSESDWKNNIRQGLGLESDYYERAQQLAQKIKYSPAGNFDVTGHSLGGGLATAAAAATGATGVTFNAAGLNGDTVANADFDALQKQLTAYHVDGEILTTLQSNVPGLPEASGKSILLPSQDGDSIVEKHLIPAIEKGLNQAASEPAAKLQKLLSGVSH